MADKPTTVAAYLAALPPERRAVLETVREHLRANLDPGYQEGLSYGMIGYGIPHSIYPDGYHCDPRQPVPFVALAAQKNHCALYLMGLYADPAEVAWFTKAWAKTGKKLDLGKSCLRFRSVDDLALDVLGEALRRLPVPRYLALYTAMRPAPKGKGGAKAAAKAAPAKAKAAAKAQGTPAAKPKTKPKTTATAKPKAAARRTAGKAAPRSR